MLINYVRRISTLVLLCLISARSFAQSTPPTSHAPTLEQQYAIVLKQYQDGKSDPPFLENLVAMAVAVKDQATAEKIMDHFYRDGASIDQIMKIPGYSAHFIDRFVWATEVKPVLLPNGKVSSSEPEWKALSAAIARRFDATCAQRNVLTARADWSYRHEDYPAFASFIDERVRKFPPNPIPGLDGDPEVLNIHAWNMFLHSSDKRVLSSALKWSDLSMKLESELRNFTVLNGFLDTKANLLYKVGRTEEAMVLEEQAAVQAEALGDMEYSGVFGKTVEEMKNHEPTWVAGARPDIP